MRLDETFYSFPTQFALTCRLLLKSTISKLWPRSQIRPNTRFCRVLELRMIFILLWLKTNQKKKNIYDKGKLYEIQISVYRNKVLLEHGHLFMYVVHDCFGVTRAGLSSCNRKCVAQKA